MDDENLAIRLCERLKPRTVRCAAAQPGEETPATRLGNSHSGLVMAYIL